MPHGAGGATAALAGGPDLAAPRGGRARGGLHASLAQPVWPPRPRPRARVAAEALSFLGAPPPRGAATSFGQVSIKFTPKASEVQQQELQCEGDLAVCNRECEKIYGERRAEMMEPCKLAVAQHFTETGCFPSQACVVDRRRGSVPIAEVRVGDEILSAGCAYSPVVALLHADCSSLALFLHVEHDGGHLAASPEHLLRTRRGPRQGRPAAEWAWRPAQDVRIGDELEAAGGEPLAVRGVSRVCLRGLFAPLTADGSLVVEGVTCSCFAPPARAAVPHEVCQAAMLPLRLLEHLRQAVEGWSRLPGAGSPLLTVEAMWLLPRGAVDRTVHPYAAGLLVAAGLAEAAELGVRPAKQHPDAPQARRG